MLRVRIELLPHGDESQARSLGEIRIANDGTGTELVSNYTVELMKSAEYAKSAGVWKSGRVVGFERQRLGPYDLLFRALAACVGFRNQKGPPHGR